MNSKILYFVGGVVAGSVATFLILKKRMDAQIEQEIAEVKETYSARAKEIEENESQESEDQAAIRLQRARQIVALNNQKKQDLITNSNIIQRQNYNAFSNPPKDEDLDLVDEDSNEVTAYPRDDLADKPYVISPDQFVNECPFYDKTTLEYFEDGVLAEALSEDIIEDINKTIGEKSLEKVGEYEEDVVYVRNERYSTDYEVIVQHRPFARLDE